jgi:hypothetical protein
MITDDRIGWAGRRSIRRRPSAAGDPTTPAAPMRAAGRTGIQGDHLCRWRVGVCPGVEVADDAGLADAVGERGARGIVSFLHRQIVRQVFQAKLEPIQPPAPVHSSVTMRVLLCPVLLPVSRFTSTVSRSPALGVIGISSQSSGPWHRGT